MQLQILLLLPMAFLLPPGALAGEIIGGQEAKPHSRPYMAYLSIQRGDETYRCGGFLVSKNFMLTAAHCTGDKINVTLGAHNIKRQERSQQKMTVSRQIPHPQYDRKTHNNDIMLLKLEKKAKLNKWVKTINLPHVKERVKPGMKCSVAGWGWTVPRDNSSLATTLREVDVKVLKNEQCIYFYYDTSTMMCVGDPDTDKNSAKGDSGGPLVCGKKAQGIVSKGYKNGTPPSVFTRVSSFIPWIQKMMRTLEP